VIENYYLMGESRPIHCSFMTLANGAGSALMFVRHLLGDLWRPVTYPGHQGLEIVD